MLIAARSIYTVLALGAFVALGGAPATLWRPLELGLFVVVIGFEAYRGRSHPRGQRIELLHRAVLGTGVLLLILDLVLIAQNLTAGAFVLGEGIGRFLATAFWIGAMLFGTKKRLPP